MRRTVFLLSLILLGTVFIIGCSQAIEELEEPAYGRPTVLPYALALPAAAQTEEPDTFHVIIEVVNLREPGEKLLPSDPLILHFSEPMNPVVSTRVIRLDPPIEGAVTWNSAQNTLTLTPQDGFTPGESYTINLLATLQTGAGKSLENSKPLVFRIEPLPRVTQWFPRRSNLTDRFPSLGVKFSKSMDKESVENAIDVEPSIDFHLVWDSLSAITIEVDEPLSTGIKYRFFVTSGAEDIHGLPLLDERDGFVWLDEFEYEMSKPGHLITENPLSFSFNYPIESQSFERSFKLNPETSGVFQWSQDMRQVSFSPIPAFIPDTEYTIEFTDPLFDLENFEVGTLPQMSFRSPPPLLELQPLPNQKDVDTHEFQIGFDRAMDQLASQDAFHVDPPLSGYFTWDENNMIFHLNEYLTEYITYTITITEGARDAEGHQIFKQPFTWSFDSDSHIPHSKFGEGGSKIQVVDANGLRGVQFGLAKTEPTRVFFDLYKLTMRQLIDLAEEDPSFENPSFLDMDEGEGIVRSWEITSGLEGEHWNIKQVYVPEDVDPGIYIMVMKIDGRIEDQIVVVLTENTMVVKRAGRNLMVWVTDIHGDIVPYVEIRLYTTDSSQIRETYTDERGVYRTTLRSADEPLLILARDKFEDVTASGVNTVWQEQNEYFWRWRRTRPITVQPNMAYVYTDRPIYKPGQSVLFKAIVREEDDLRYSLYPAGTPIDVLIRDTRDNLLQTFNLFTNDFGSVTGEFQLAEGAMLGEYTIEVLVEGERHSGEFKVEDYRKPDILVDVSTEAGRYVQGQGITLDIEAKYLFGEPAAGATVIVRQYQLGYFYGYWWEDRPEGDEIEYTWHASSQPEIKGKLNAAGQFTTIITASLGNSEHVWDSWRDSLMTSTWGIEVTISDGSNQTVSNFTVYKVFNAAEKLRMEANGYSFTFGEEIEAEASVNSISDEPVPDHPMRLEILRWENSQRSYQIVGEVIHMISDADGLAKLSFSLADEGYYKLSLISEDDFGNEITSNDWIAVYEKNNMWGSTNRSEDLTISVDRDTFAPFQTVTLEIESTFDGPALITVERGKVLREKLVHLTPPLTFVELSLHEIDVPNIFVVVSAWKAQPTTPAEYEYSNLPESRLLHDSVELKVSSKIKELQVEIIPDQDSYQPGDEASVMIIVTDQGGNPVSAEVSLAVVDEAIFSLSEELSDSMIDAFYGRRLNAVRTYNSMAPFRWIWTPGRGGGGGGGEGGPPHDLRSDFSDTAIWLPVLRTNSSGETAATFTLPDNLTTWRMTAKAVTRETKVGEITTEINTHQELVVKPLLPRHMILGDRMMLSAMVHNYTDRGRWIDVSLETTNLVIEGDVIQQVFVEADEILVVGWEVHAEQTGQAQVTVTADASDIRDAIKLSFPISPLAIADVFSESGRVEHEFEMDFDIPDEAIKESSLTIELSRSINGNLLSGLEYLTGFPYGCVEQIMSKALPNAVVGRALNIADAGVPNLSYDLSEKINLGLQMLYAKQHQDGGWGWWYDDDSHDYQTAWVVFGLAMTSEARYQVDLNVIQRGVDWLSAHLSQMDPRTEAFALYAMSLSGNGDLEAMLELSEKVHELDTFSIAALALAFEKQGEIDKAQEMLTILEASAVQTGSQVYWDLPYGDGYYERKTMASSTRSTALALSAFVRIDPDHELIPGIVRWLMEKRQPYGWGTTNETSFAVLGLTDYIVSAVLVIEVTDYTVELNGHEIAQGTVNSDLPLVKIEVGYDQMVPGENILRILRSGDGKLYYVVVSKTYMAREAITADGEIEISRTYFNADTNQRIEHVEAGSLVKVELLVHMPDVGHYMIVEDYLPGGLEALNEGLNTASRWLGEANYVEPDYRWKSLGYNNKEVYGNRVSFFVTEMSKGRHKFTYFARATNSGTFVALPTQAWGMYDLAFWGRSASNSIGIIDDRFVIRGADDDLAASRPDSRTNNLEADVNSFVRSVNNEGEEHRFQDFVGSNRFLSEDN